MLSRVERLLRGRWQQLVVVGLLLFAATESLAQPFELASENQIDRERMFTELARDVDQLERELGIYKRVAKLVSPSVVHVESTPLPQFRYRNVEEAGSGVLVRYRDYDYVLTNRHVVRHSSVDLIRLELASGRQIKAVKMWSDPETDVAVLQVAAQALVPARIGNSDSAEIGDIVLAFGSPFNLRHSVTRGIISAKGRSNLDLGDGEVNYQKFIQTDAAINPGNSGGPLVNLRAEVIGLNTAIASNSGGNEGIGFTIPINVAVRIMRELIDTGTVDGGYLGVILDARFDGEAAQGLGLPRLMGTRVSEIKASSPAAEADLRKDDVILRFDGMEIEDMRHLINLVKRTEIDSKVELMVFRDGRFERRTVNIGRRRDYNPPEE